MAISTSKEYIILSNGGAGASGEALEFPCLNVYGLDTVSAGRPVTIYENEKALSQTWVFVPSPVGGYHIVTKASPANSFALNYSASASTLGKCTMWRYAESGAAEDTSVALVDLGNNVYKLRLYNSKGGSYKYLTADGTANNSLVSWSTESTSNLQKWKIIEKSSTPSGGSKTLNLSYKAINQKFYGKYATSSQKVKWGNFNALESNDPMYLAGCSRCSVACILSNIQGIEINPYDVPVVRDGTWEEGDFNVNFVDIPSKKIISTSIVHEIISSGGTTDNLAGVKSCIDSGYPAICKIGSGTSTHFFVAYGYTNGAATTSDVLTYDTVYPKNYQNPDQQNTTLYGEVSTMSRVMSLNGINTLTQVFTYKRA